MFRIVYLFVYLFIAVAKPNSTFTKHGLLRTKRQGTAEERMCALPQPLVNGRYSPNSKRCPPHISNAACKIVPGTLVPSDWDIFYGCDDGFILNSTDSVSFCTDGHWSPALAECIAGELCSALKSQYLNIKCTFQGKEVSCSQAVKPGTMATLECKTNYKPAYQTGYSYITCLNNGYWDYPLFYCTPENLCPPLKKPHNMNILYIHHDKAVPSDQNMKPGTIAIPSCKYNYRPAYDPGYSNLTCLNSGGWDQQLFHCMAVCGASNKVGLLTTLIVDGVEAHVGAFPWHAGLYYRQVEEGGETWDQRCGGSLITDQFVLTAAHCVANVHNVEDLRVALGKYYRSWDTYEHTAEKRNVSMILYPREYSQKTFLFDMAILMLDKKIELGEFIMPVCHGFLNGSAYIKDKDLFVVGWGKTEKRISSETLLYKAVTVLPIDDCLQKAPSVFPTFDKFCTGNNGSELSVAQRGDSGGGVTAVHEGLHYIFGLVSIRFDNITFFTNITWNFNLNWMEGEVKNYHPNFSWDSNEFQANPNSARPRRCMLPQDSANRKFCSQAYGCENCDGKCVIPPGSEATRVKVTCNPGYTLRGSADAVYSGGDVATCLSGGSWYPHIPDCIKIPSKKYVGGDPWTYVTWDEAYNNCKAKGRRLATIKNYDEQKMFEDATDKKFNKTGNSGESMSVWIGLRETIGDRSVKLSWVSVKTDGEKDFKLWYKVKPNHLELQKDCVQVEPGNEDDRQTTNTGNNASCHHQNFYFCMKKNSVDEYTPGDPWKKVTWQEAFDNCESKGLQLAIMPSQTQEQALAAAAASKFTLTGYKYLWVGRNFSWVDDTALGSPGAVFTNWLPTEPNDPGATCIRAEGRENVHPQSPQSYRWNDHLCSDKRYYFCEDKSDPSNANLTPGNPWIKVTWHEARNNCEKNGKQLVTLKSRQQMKRFNEVVGNYYRNIGESVASVWIGLSSNGLAFQWVDGTQLGDVADWLAGEPNSAGGGENCVEVIPEEANRPPYQWSDGNCTEKKLYFCEEEDVGGL